MEQMDGWSLVTASHHASVLAPRQYQPKLRAVPRQHLQDSEPRARISNGSGLPRTVGDLGI